MRAKVRGKWAATARKAGKEEERMAGRAREEGITGETIVVRERGKETRLIEGRKQEGRREG